MRPDDCGAPVVPQLGSDAGNPCGRQRLSNLLGADWRISPAVRLFLLRPEASPHRGGRAGHHLLSQMEAVQTGLPVGDHLQEGKAGLL